MFRKAIAVVLVGVLALLSACGDDDDAGASPETLTFVVTELKGLEELQREFGAFEEVFEEKSGLQLELFPVTSRAAAAAALDSGNADLVFTGPSEYVVLRERTDAEPLVAIERPGYSSCIYTSADSGVSELSDLAGGRVAMEDVGSTSAHLGPSLLIQEAGLDPLEDVEVVLVGDAMHEALKRGDVAAVGAGCHDYAEFVPEDEAEAFPLVARGEQLPPDVIVMRSGLEDELVDLLRATFEDHWSELRDAMLAGEENDKFADATLIAVPSDTDYDVVRTMFTAIGVDEYGDFIGEE